MQRALDLSISNMNKEDYICCRAFNEEGCFLPAFVFGAESFMKGIGSQYGVVSGSRDNSLYNALWVAQALLRKG